MNVKAALGILYTALSVSGCIVSAGQPVASTPKLPGNTNLPISSSPPPIATIFPLSSAQVGQYAIATGRLLESWQMPNTLAPNTTTSPNFEPVSYDLADEQGNIIVKLKVLDQGKSLVGLNDKTITVIGKISRIIRSDTQSQPNLKVLDVEWVEVVSMPKMSLLP